MAHDQAHIETVDSPAAWFVILERSIRTGDHSRQGRARRELRRLGVRIVIATDAPWVPGKNAGAEGKVGR